jgi:hypothetical protein
MLSYQWLVAGAIFACTSTAMAEDVVTPPTAPAEQPVPVEQVTPVEQPAVTPLVSVAEETALHKENSVNVSPIGLLYGSYSVNYERLLGRQHGLLGEAQYTRSSEDGIDSSGLGVMAGYRWHWSESQESGFLGANVGYTRAASEASVDGETYNVTASGFPLVANVGYRWCWDAGFNVTFRVGAGKLMGLDLSTNSKDADAKEAVADVEKTYNKFPITFDGELSAGWVF